MPSPPALPPHPSPLPAWNGRVRDIHLRDSDWISTFDREYLDPFDQAFVDVMEVREA